MSVATVVDRKTAVHLRALVESLAQHMPEASCCVLDLENAVGSAALDGAHIDIVRPEELGPDPDAAINPLFVRFLLEEDEAVVLVDPQVRFFGSIADVEGRAARHGIALVPAVLEPIPLDGMGPTEPDIQAVGIYNSGCLGVGRSGRAFLEWHAAHLRAQSSADLSRGWSLDMRWLDFIPAYFEHEVMRDPGLGVATWNLHERDVAAAAGGYTVRDSPLRLFNFRGFDLAQPGLTKYAFHSRLPPRIDTRAHGVVVELGRAYLRSLGAAA